MRGGDAVNLKNVGQRSAYIILLFDVHNAHKNANLDKINSMIVLDVKSLEHLGRFACNT